MRREEARNVLEEFVAPAQDLGSMFSNQRNVSSCRILSICDKASHMLLRTKSNRFKRLFPQNPLKWEFYNRLDQNPLSLKHTQTPHWKVRYQVCKSKFLTLNLLNFLEAAVRGCMESELLCCSDKLPWAQEGTTQVISLSSWPSFGKESQGCHRLQYDFIYKIQM